MNGHIDEISWDSADNWVDIILVFDKPELGIFREIVLHMVPKVLQLKADHKITHWHFRYGSNGTDVAFRLRSGTRHKDEVLQAIQECAKELKHLNVITSYGTDPQNDRAWIASDEKLQEYYELPQNWVWQIESDELLSEVTYKALTQKNYVHKFFSAIHNLLNMFCLQELGGPHEFKSDAHDPLLSLLERDYAEALRRQLQKWGSVHLYSILFFSFVSSSKES